MFYSMALSKNYLFLREYDEFLLRVDVKRVNQLGVEVLSKKFGFKIEKVGIDEKVLKVFP